MDNKTTKHTDSQQVKPKMKAKRGGGVNPANLSDTKRWFKHSHTRAKLNQFPTWKEEQILRLPSTKPEGVLAWGVLVNKIQDEAPEGIKKKQAFDILSDEFYRIFGYLRFDKYDSFKSQHSKALTKKINQKLKPTG